MGTLTRSLLSSSASTIALSRLDLLPASLTPTRTFLALFVLLFLVQAAYNILIYPHFVSPLRHLPSPAGSSIFNGEFVTIMTKPTGEPQKAYLRIPNSGLIHYRSFFNHSRLMPTSVRVLQQALTTDAEIWTKPSMLRLGIFALALGPKGLLFSEGNEHRVQRRIITPAFARAQIRRLVPGFWKKSVALAERLETAALAGDVDVHPWASRATLDIVGSAALGTEFNTMEGEGSELANAYRTLFGSRRGGEGPLRLVRIVSMLILPSKAAYWLPGSRHRSLRAAHRTIMKVAGELVRDKKAALKAKGVTGEEKDVLSVMLNSGEYDTPEGEEIVRDQIMTFLAAGHETTATLLVWAIHLLTQNPSYQTQLRAEIRAAFPSGCPDSSSITCEQLDSLKLLRNITEEVGRMYPPVPLIMRENNQPTTLNGTFVPTGTMLIIAPWALNRDPTVWGADADEFRPERWDEEGVATSNYSVLTFLAGPRSCIGMGFAKTEFKALLAALVGRLEFEKRMEAGELEIQGGVTSRPKGGLKVGIRVVEGW